MAVTDPAEEGVEAAEGPEAAEDGLLEDRQDHPVLPGCGGVGMLWYTLKVW